MRKLSLALLAVFALAACGQDETVPTAPTPSVGIETEDNVEFDLTPIIEKGHGVGATIRSYEITLENLTPDNGGGAAQVFSPPVIATHNRSLRMFRVGKFASEGLALIAEDAINQPMFDRFDNSPAAFDVQEGGGVIPPGTSATYTVQTRGGARRLSMAFMLVNTNDAFSGTDAIRLPRDGVSEYYLSAYDAGSEENTELTAHIPGPCCGSPGEGIDTRERIRKHAGIHGDGDLDPAIWGWEGPVAKLTIRRIPRTYEITLENLTADTGDGGAQVFSPPVIATHNPAIRMFRVGHIASDELALIAEDAINQPMVDLLEGSDRVSEVQVGGGVIPPGGTDTYTVVAERGFNRLSMAFMLVNTNDAFSGVSRLPLRWFDGRVSYYLHTYDAGSEENTELFEHIPGPCCTGAGEGNDTHERIRHHRGIQGTADLDAAKWGWDDPAAKLTVTRIY